MVAVGNNFLEIKKDLRELKDRENKIRKEIEELKPLPRCKKAFMENYDLQS